MPINWAEKYINRMIDGKSLEEKVRISLQEYLANKSKVFKILNSLIYELVIEITDFAAEYPDDDDIGAIDLICQEFITDFNTDNDTNFHYSNTPVYNSSGAVFNLLSICRAYYSKIQEVPVLDEDTNWYWTIVGDYPNIDACDPDSSYALQDDIMQLPPMSAHDYEWDTIFVYRPDGSGRLYLKNVTIDYTGDGIGITIATLPLNEIHDIDDVLIDQAQILQNCKILESSLMIMSGNTASYSDMRQIAVSNNSELTNDSESYLQSVYTIISNKQQNMVTKISSLLSPNIDAIQGIGDVPANGLVIASVNMGDYTGISPFNAFKNSIDINIDASAFVEGVAIGVKAIGKAASWLWKQTVKGVNYVAKLVDENVINAKDFGVANKESNDLFFDVPLIQGIVTNSNFSYFGPEILKDGMSYDLFSDSEVSDKLKAEGGVIEIPTNAGSIFLSWDGSQWVYQIYLIPTTPLNTTIANIPIPFFNSMNNGIYSNPESKTYRWYLETVIGNDVSIDPTEDHTDQWWYRALQASRVRMEFFLWILYNHGKDLEYILDVTSFTDAYLATHVNDLFGKFRNINSTIVNGVDYLFTDLNDYGHTYSGLSLSEAVALDGDYYAPVDFEPTNADFIALCAPSQNYVTQATAGSGADPASLIIRGITNLITINSFEGMRFTLSQDGVVGPFIPYLHRNTPIDPRYSISTDDENGDVIGKVILGAAIAIAVVAALAIGLKMRAKTRKKLVDLDAQVSSYNWELSQMSLNDPLRAPFIAESVKLSKKLKRTKKLGKLLGLGVTSIAPAAAFSAFAPDNKELSDNVVGISTRVGGV